MRRQRRGNTFVESGPLTGQQVAVHGLVAEGVAEGVELSRPHHQLAAHRLTDRRVDGGGVEVGDVAEQGIAHAAPDDCGDTQQALGRRFGTRHTLEDEVADRGRKVFPSPGGDELLDEERVALAAFDDPVEPGHRQRRIR